MIPQRYEWTTDDFVAGALCLELANTVGDHSKTRDVERLTDWDTLLKWAVAAKVLRVAEARELRKAGDHDPSSAQQALQALLKFREVLFKIVSALAAAHLVRQGEGFDWTIGSIDAPLKMPLFRVALSALRLLQGKELPYLRECQRCSWVFVDRSKSHGRRWCRADACGNRARVARHYHAKSS
jgi:predicted RNA-binding Zn ribbon-like protein